MTLSALDIILAGLIAAILTTGCILLIFLILVKRNKVIKGFLIELSGISGYFQNFRSIYSRLIGQKELIKNIITNSVAKSPDEVHNNLESAYKDLDQIVLEYIREVEKFENTIDSSKRG